MAYQRKDGKRFWYASFMYRGKPVQERAGTKNEALALERKRKREVAEGRYLPQADKKATVAEYARAWFPQRRVRDARRDEARFDNHITPALGKLKLEDVEPRDVLRLVREKKVEGKVADKTIANAVAIFRSMCEHALIEGVITRNPCKLPRGELKKAPQKPTEIYTPSEVMRLTTDTRIDQRYRTLLSTTLYSGMRIGEAAGLRWGDVDFEAKPLGAIAVLRQYDNKPLKTERPRMVPLHPVLRAALLAWYSGGYESYHGYAPTDDRIIFPRDIGYGAIRSGTVYRRVKQECEKVGVKFIHIHATRHTFLTRARRCGARKDVLERFTHNAKGDIIDRYTHFDWAPLCEAMAVVDYKPDHDALHDASLESCEIPANLLCRRRDLNPRPYSSSCVMSRRLVSNQVVSSQEVNPVPRPLAKTLGKNRSSHDTRHDCPTCGQPLPDDKEKVG